MGGCLLSRVFFGRARHGYAMPCHAMPGISPSPSTYLSLSLKEVRFTFFFLFFLVMARKGWRGTSCGVCVYVCVYVCVCVWCVGHMDARACGLCAGQDCRVFCDGLERPFSLTMCDGCGGLGYLERERELRRRRRRLLLLDTDQVPRPKIHPGSLIFHVCPSGRRTYRTCYLAIRWALLIHSMC